MKVEVLNEFIVLANCKSFSKASEYLFIGQSTLTKHIQQLEEELGTNLINHSKASFSLTLDGIVFYDYATKIVNLKQDYMNRIAAPVSSNETSLDIGTGYLSHEEHTVLIQALEDFSRLFPRCSINTVRFNDLHHCRALLRNGGISLAIIKYAHDVLVSFAGEPKLEFDLIPLYEVPIIGILPKEHPLAGKKISISDLANEPFVLGARNTFRFSQSLTVCHTAGFEPHIAHTFDKPDLIISFVEQGKGVSLGTEPMISKFADRGIRFVHFEPQLSEKTAIICIQNTVSYSTERHFINCVINAVEHAGYMED